MAQLVINVGNVANDGQGDPVRTAFEKSNQNFTELYNIGGLSGIANGTSNIQIVQDSTVSISAANVANVFVVSGTGATIQGTLLANTTISATGNITSGGFFVGDGSLITGVTASAPASQITGTTLSANVINSSLQTLGTLTSLAVTGNAAGGNLISTGIITASGNVAGQNFVTNGAVSAAGNVNGGNINTPGVVGVGGGITALGNVTASYFVGDGSLDRKSVV